MEKTNNHKSFFLKFLPKAASAVNFQNTPFSPGRDHHHNHNYHHSSTKLKSHANKGFSGPINFAALPDEARQKPTNVNGGYDSIEPTSPKVSCMGQIKCKHKKKKLLLKTAKNEHVTTKSSSREKLSMFFSKDSKKSSSNNSKKVSNSSKSDVHDNSNKVMMPSLGQMRKFASGRESLGNFDWTAQIAPIDHDRDCYSDEERRRDSDDDEDEDEEERREVIIPFSAPILLGGRNGEMLNCTKRKEVCLWKRRTMDPPPPLTLKPTR